MNTDLMQVITIAIAALSFLVAFASLWIKSKGGAADDAAAFAKVNAKLDMLCASIEELKDDIKSANKEIEHTRQTAELALERANRANDRLDKADL